MEAAGPKGAEERSHRPTEERYEKRGNHRRAGYWKSVQRADGGHPAAGATAGAALSTREYGCRDSNTNPDANADDNLLWSAGLIVSISGSFICRMRAKSYVTQCLGTMHTRKLLSRLEISMRISMIAMVMPRHTRGPLWNNVNLKGENMSSLPVVGYNQCSGLNCGASGPQTFSMRLIV